MKIAVPYKEFCLLRRQTVAGDAQHHVNEPIELRESCVNIRRDANSLKFAANDGQGKDVVTFLAQ